MNHRSLGALIALNVVLLAALLIVGLTPDKAQAQLARSEYLMISGLATGRSQQAAIYIVEVKSARMVAILFNTANDTLDVVASRTMIDDFRATDRR